MSGVRLHRKAAVHFVTNRCLQERLLLLPRSKTNALILEWLAKALSFVDGGVELFAFIFLSNHFHLLLRDNSGRLAEFMGYFQGNLAKAVNKELSRRGKFFGREYDDVLLDGDEDLLDRYAYILCNAVKAGLVQRADDWRGISSLDLALSGEALQIGAVNWTKLHNATRRGQKVDRADFVEQHELRVSPPPAWAALQHGERAKLTRQLVATWEAHFNSLRGNKPALGMKKVFAQSPTSRPLDSSFRPRVKVFARDPNRREELLEGYRTHVSAYRTTLQAFLKAAQLGRRPAVEWPAWAYPPSSAIPIGFGRAV